MGRLGGFRYRDVVRRLKQCGFAFDRQAAGSHGIWFNPGTHRYTTIPNHPGDLPEGTLVLSRELRAQSDVQLGLLFGSVGEGRAGPDSDVDVAVWMERPLAGERRRELTEILAVASGRPVDLVDLRMAGPMILRSALSGRRLVDRQSSLYASLLSRALIDGADFLPCRARILRQRRDAWIN